MIEIHFKVITEESLNSHITTGHKKVRLKMTLKGLIWYVQMFCVVKCFEVSRNYGPLKCG